MEGALEGRMGGGASKETLSKVDKIRETANCLTSDDEGLDELHACIRTHIKRIACILWRRHIDHILFNVDIASCDARRMIKV